MTARCRRREHIPHTPAPPAQSSPAHGQPEGLTTADFNTRAR